MIKQAGHFAQKLLILDDEVKVLNALKRILRTEDFMVLTESNPYTAVRLLDSVEFQVIISDYRMPGMNGLEFLRRAKDKQPNAIRIILSGLSDNEAVIEAINTGEIYRYLQKPFDNARLAEEIRSYFVL